ncbi:MAG: NAD-dependent epimerase/dehydratase family protein [Synergistaceae bacterium]|nr:NAD-dependent epimerase/dehydratase family protein [Synergistaceae bacterium]
MPTYDKTQTYLITGGAGFIGSNLVHHLTSIRYKTVVLFN